MSHNMAAMLLLTFLSVVWLASSSASPIAEAEYQWPSGLYTLPMADTQADCPESGSGISWDYGYRYQDTESIPIPLIGGNEWSSPNNLMGPHGKKHMTWNFCSKTDTADDKNSTAIWGSGKYCVMKLGTNCPVDFDEGSIQWDDDDFTNDNGADGTLPEGVYDKDTKIYFCCREDGNTVVPLNLPNKDPFILFMKEQATCQNVNGMVDSQQWFKWDGEDDLLGFERYFSGSVPFHDGRSNNHIIHFCYYEPI